MTVSVASTITTSSYNTILETISQILNPTQGGYGANLRLSTTATNRIVASYLHWNALYDDVNKTIKHQTGSNIPNVTPPAVGALITATFVNNLAAAATTAVANSLTVHVSQLAPASSSTFIVNTPWNSQIEIDRTYTWDSNLRAHYHFNLGGYIISTIGSDGVVGNVADQGFQEFVHHANNPVYSTLKTDPYNRSRWLGPFGTTVTNYSTSTSAGVFTATITYTRGTNSVGVKTAITPPVGIGNILLVPTSTATLYYSTDAISAQRPSIVTDRKILSVNALNPFNFPAGTRSLPQQLVISNVGSEPITITDLYSTSIGAIGYTVSTATNLSGQFPIVIPLTFPIVIQPNDDYAVTVFYYEENRSTSEIGSFNNNIVITSDADDSLFLVPTVQNVSAPEFDFTLTLTDLSQQYTYTDWQTEYGLSGPDRILGINIANTYYRSNTNFGVIAGKQRYGLYRAPDAEGLLGWVNYTKATYGGDYTQIANEFFQGADANSSDANRSLISNKSFDSGFGYGDFYDKTKVNTNIVGSTLFQYAIQPFFGSVNATATFPGYTISLSNQSYNGSPSSEAVQAFGTFNTLAGGFLRGPTVTFSPIVVNNTGTYSTDVTVSVTATDLNNAVVTKSKTVNLTINLLSLVDGNLVQWLSPFEADDAVMGMSLDRINGQLVLTVGVGSGADSGPTLQSLGYQPTYINLDNLGINSDPYWTSKKNGFNLPMYKITYGGSWSGFMNTYAVWPYNPAYDSRGSWPQSVYLTRKYKFTAPSNGNYTVEFAVDDYGYISIDGAIIVNASSPGSFRGSLSNMVSLTAGEHTVELVFLNNLGYSYGNPGGVAATIRSPSNNLVWSTLDEVRYTPPYLYWPEVYRIPIEAGVAKNYKLNDYLCKNNYPVDGYPTGYYRYGEFFGTPGTSDVGSIMTVDSDGKGNLSFNWVTDTTTAPTSTANQTINGIKQLPYYYSVYTSRKVNRGSSGPNTQKLVGISPKGVKTISVPTPGYGTTVEGNTSYIRGWPAGGRGPAIAPGRQYNVPENNYVNVGFYAPVSKHWISDEVRNYAEATEDYSVLRWYSATRTIAIKHPESTISNQELENWGFGSNEVLTGRDLKLTRVQVVQDYRVQFRWAVIEKGMTSINDNPPSGGENFLVEQIHYPGGRGYYDYYGPWQLPDPAPHQLVYLVIVDGTGGAARGFNDCTLTFSYIPL